MPTKPAFTPVTEDTAWYYDIQTPAFRRWSSFRTLLGMIKSNHDSTFGRDKLPFSPAEQALPDDPAYQIDDARVYLNEGETEWIYYQVWQAKAPNKQPHADLIYVHGVNDYGGKWSDHAAKFLISGYRIIVPDLPGHGRSTGLHGYIPDLMGILPSLDAVINDVAAKDQTSGLRRAARKRFLAAASMGGCLALLYALEIACPTGGEDVLSREEVNSKTGHSIAPDRPRIDGLLLLCPLIDLSPESRPPKFVHRIPTRLARIVGRLPLKVGSGDRSPVDEWEMDPATYNGRMRVATGLACLAGMKAVQARLAEIRLPFKVIHGVADTITWYKGSQQLFLESPSMDKEITIHPKADHILLKVGRNSAEDAQRQDIIGEMLDWLDRH